MIDVDTLEQIISDFDGNVHSTEFAKELIKHLERSLPKPEASEVERLTKVIEKAKEWVLANYPPEQYEQDTDIENLWIALDESEKAIAAMRPALVDDKLIDEIGFKIHTCTSCIINPSVSYSKLPQHSIDQYHSAAREVTKLIQRPIKPVEGSHE